MDRQRTKNQITYNEFMNLEIRVVEVIHAEPIPQRKRILKLTVQTGVGDNRTIVAGGAQFYSPEYFIGKKIAALLNLAPKKIAGIMSHGMLLAANVNNKPFWLVMDENTPIGAKII
ncbi:MAG: tRNA-binding protein [Candidatus Hodarchaeota archaeon]